MSGIERGVHAAAMRWQGAGHVTTSSFDGEIAAYEERAADLERRVAELPPLKPESRYGSGAIYLRPLSLPSGVTPQVELARLNDLFSLQIESAGIVETKKGLAAALPLRAAAGETRRQMEAVEHHLASVERIEARKAERFLREQHRELRDKIASLQGWLSSLEAQRSAELAAADQALQRQFVTDCLARPDATHRASAELRPRGAREWLPPQELPRTIWLDWRPGRDPTRATAWFGSTQAKNIVIYRRIVQPSNGGDSRSSRKRTDDPRNKTDEMLSALCKAVTEGWLKPGKPMTLKAAHSAMLRAIGVREPPSGMGYDVFRGDGQIRAWLKKHGISG